MESLSIKGKYHFLRQKDDNLPFDACTYFSDIMFYYSYEAKGKYSTFTLKLHWFVSKRFVSWPPVIN